MASPSPLALSRSKPSSSPSADRSHRESSVYTRSPLRVATQAFDITHNTSCWPKSSPWSLGMWWRPWNWRGSWGPASCPVESASQFQWMSSHGRQAPIFPCGPRAGVARRTAGPAGACGATRRIGFRATLGENERRETERPLRTQSSEMGAFVDTFETPASYYRALRLASRTDGTVRRTRFPFFFYGSRAPDDGRPGH